MTRFHPARSLALPAATLGALAATSASGNILYWSSGETALDHGATIYFDLDTGTTSHSTFDGWDASLWSDTSFPGELDMAYARVDVSAQTSSLRGTGYSGNNSENALRLDFGAAIGPAGNGQSWLSGAGTLQYEFLPGAIGGYWSPGSPTRGTGYLGFAISNGSGAINYGWAHISFNEDHSLTLHDFAVESTPNTAIQAGAIPEPSTYAAITGLLAGSAALYARRRQRAA